MKPFENLGRVAGNGNGHTERRPGDVEQEIQRTRDRMQETIDAIRRDLSPGQIVDQAVHAMREGRARDLTSSALKSAGGVVRDNPLPAAVIGIGIVWLAASQRRGAQPRRTVSGEAPGFAPNEPAYEPEHASRTKERVGRMAHDARERVSDVTHGAAERARGVASSARTRGANTFDAQPLVVGAIAVGLGALLGALLPPSSSEDRLLGARRDQLKRKVDEAGAEILGRVKQDGGFSDSGTQGAWTVSVPPDIEGVVPGDVARDVHLQGDVRTEGKAVEASEGREDDDTSTR